VHLDECFIELLSDGCAMLSDSFESLSFIFEGGWYLTKRHLYKMASLVNASVFI
jgi:hypothetical protein